LLFRKLFFGLAVWKLTECCNVFKKSRDIMNTHGETHEFCMCRYMIIFMSKE